MMKTLSPVLSHPSVRRARGFFKHFAIAAFALSSAVHGANEKNVNLLSPQEQLKKFKLAPGFEIELVACEAMGTKKIVDVAFEFAEGRNAHSASDLGFKFSTNGDVEGWSTAGSISGIVVGGGVYSGTASA